MNYETIFSLICEHFYQTGIMTKADFDEICDEVEKEAGEKCLCNEGVSNGVEFDSACKINHSEEN